ncbi:unnamed protein product [Amoebophrya sp. A25]|nr:unnamed protein product [Amoebophrya sp. A25]|eukprot:GSA25T00003890001.1
MSSSWCTSLQRSISVACRVGPPVVMIKDQVGCISFVRGESMSPLLNPPKEFRFTTTSESSSSRTGNTTLSGGGGSPEAIAVEVEDIKPSDQNFLKTAYKKAQDLLSRIPRLFDDIVVVMRDASPRVGDLVIAKEPYRSGPWDRKIVKRLVKIGGDGGCGTSHFMNSCVQPMPLPSTISSTNTDTNTDTNMNCPASSTRTGETRTDYGRDHDPERTSGIRDHQEERPKNKYVDRGVLPHVPVGRAWLLGDNAAASRDSRQYGAVPLPLIQGVAVLRVWPPWRQQWLLDEEGNTVIS